MHAAVLDSRQLTRTFGGGNSELIHRPSLQPANRNDPGVETLPSLTRTGGRKVSRFHCRSSTQCTFKARCLSASFAEPKQTMTSQSAAYLFAGMTGGDENTMRVMFRTRWSIWLTPTKSFVFFPSFSQRQRLRSAPLGRQLKGGRGRRRSRPRRPMAMGLRLLSGPAHRISTKFVTLVTRLRKDGNGGRSITSSCARCGTISTTVPLL
jgi:hypothetical protein